MIQDVTTLHYDNMSAINISKILVQHRKTKHIDIQHHFISKLVKEKEISLEHVRSDGELADI